MAQRKPKEPLLAEVPRPRLSDEELMELFYSGQRKATERQKEHDDTFSAEAAPPELSSRNITEKVEGDKPSPEKGTLKEGYPQVPLRNDARQDKIPRPSRDEQFGDKAQQFLPTTLDTRSDQGETSSVEQSEQKLSISIKGSHEEPSLEEPTDKEPYKEEILPSPVPDRTAVVPQETVPDIFRAA